MTIKYVCDGVFQMKKKNQLWVDSNRPHQWAIKANFIKLVQLKRLQISDDFYLNFHFALVIYISFHNINIE